MRSNVAVCPQGALRQRSGPVGPWGRSGWSEGGCALWVGPSTSAAPRPPTPAPWASGARFAVWVCSSGSWDLGGWVLGIALPYTHPYTHPVYRPGPIPTPYTPAGPLAGHGTHRSYTAFGPPVGEPRGIRTHTYFRVPGWLLAGGRVYTAV